MLSRKHVAQLPIKISATFLLENHIRVTVAVIFRKNQSDVLVTW